MNWWTNSASLHAAIPRRGLHKPCCLWGLCSDRPGFPSPIPLHIDQEMFHAGSPFSVPSDSSDRASRSRSPNERLDRRLLRSCRGPPAVLLLRIDLPRRTLALLEPILLPPPVPL